MVFKLAILLEYFWVGGGGGDSGTYVIDSKLSQPCC